MTRTAVARQFPRPAAVETAVLRQLTAYCPLCGRVMSWAIGLLPRNIGGNKIKSHEGSQRSTEKLQGFHALAEDALESAYRHHLSGNKAEAIKSYRIGIAAIDEGLSLQVPEAWLTGSNVNKWRSELNSWLQVAIDRLRDLESPTASTSAPTSSIVKKTCSTQPPQRSTRQQATQQSLQQPAERRDRQTTVITRQRSAPDKRKENAEEAKLREAVLSEVLDIKPAESWRDIAGLSGAKQVTDLGFCCECYQPFQLLTSVASLCSDLRVQHCKVLQEMVILPTQRADLFQGLRAPARGLLLYGPPGNGKTMLAKALAHEAKATFFNISAATLTSKWHGEGEKLVRMLFKVAAENQPAIIFIDEIDSILSERSSGEHDASRRLKTEFMIQCDGISSGSERIIVIGATNRPQELDDAIRRRLVKKIYIPLPDATARRVLISAMLKDQTTQLRGGDIEQVVRQTEGYSGSDLRALCQEAAMVPIRELGSAISTIAADKIRPIQLRDFVLALRQSKPSVNRSQIAGFEQWTQEFGTTG